MHVLAAMKKTGTESACMCCGVAGTDDAPPEIHGKADVVHAPLLRERVLVVALLLAALHRARAREDVYHERCEALCTRVGDVLGTAKVRDGEMVRVSVIWSSGCYVPGKFGRCRCRVGVMDSAKLFTVHCSARRKGCVADEGVGMQFLGRVVLHLELDAHALASNDAALDPYLAMFADDNALG